MIGLSARTRRAAQRHESLARSDENLLAARVVDVVRHRGAVQAALEHPEGSERVRVLEIRRPVEIEGIEPPGVVAGDYLVHPVTV